MRRAFAQFAEIAERLRRSTVQVRLTGADAGGSGVIAESAGRIVTNAHVARGGRMQVQLWDGRELPARLLSRDDRRDLALLQIDASALPTAAFADSNALRVGEMVLAVGSPMGFAGALSTGVVHGLGTVAGMGGQSFVLANVRLAPGNSGGPLADAEGRVVGINTMIVGGLGAAIPSNAIRAFLRRGGDRLRLGVTIQAVRLEDRRLGLVVLKVEPGSLADAAPLWVGDVLTGAEGRAFRSADDLHQAIEDAAGVLHLQFLRGDRNAPRTVAIRLPSAVAEAA